MIMTARWTMHLRNIMCCLQAHCLVASGCKSIPQESSPVEHDPAALCVGHYPQLGKHEHVYVDFGGAALASQQQVRSAVPRLLEPGCGLLQQLVWLLLCYLLSLVSSVIMTLDLIITLVCSWGYDDCWAALQLLKHFAMLQETVLGNPHSNSMPSLAATSWVTVARQKVQICQSDSPMKQQSRHRCSRGTIRLWQK